MNINLNLSRHCIETEVKRLYNKCITQYFKHDTDKKQLEKHIKVLKELLENCNFAKLRSVYPELGGHCKAEVTLHSENQDDIVIICNDKKIIPFGE